MRLEKILPREERKGKKKILAGEPPAILLGRPFLFSPLLASLHFQKRQGDRVIPSPTGARGRRRASRNHEAVVFPEDQAEATGLPPLFAETLLVSLMQARIPAGSFPNRAAPPPRQSKLSPQKHMPKVKGGKLSFGFDFPPGSF